MKKNFKLNEPGRHPERLVEAVKHELRKYMRRESRRELPEDADYWDFDCRFGKTEADAEPIKPAEVIKRVDHAKAEKWDGFYMEIMRKPIKRDPKA